MKVIYYGETNIGNVRSINEDTFILKEIWGGTFLLGVVIDGVGGHGNGKLAAELAARCINEHFNECEKSVNSLEVLQSAVIYANNSICSLHCNTWQYNMSCVLTAVLINLETGKMEICHIGDTRLYLFKKGVLTKITTDHSLVALKEGLLSEYEVMTHPLRNIITRSVGKDFLHLGTEYIQTHILDLNSCTLLLCSDGLYEMVHTPQIVKVLQERMSADKRARKLIKAALKAGGRDNVTVIVIDVIN